METALALGLVGCRYGLFSYLDTDPCLLFQRVVKARDKWLPESRTDIAFGAVARLGFTAVGLIYHDIHHCRP